MRDIEPLRMLELLVRARPVLKAVVRFEVDPHPDGCRLQMKETLIGVFRFIAPLAQPLIRARNERSLHRLSEVVARSAARG